MLGEGCLNEYVFVHSPFEPYEKWIQATSRNCSIHGKSHVQIG